MILSHEFFYAKTDVFFDFYKKFMMPLTAKPNAAHVALAKLEKEGLLDAVITQNIDGLHQAAGSKKVLELHGSIHRNTCLECGRKFDARYVEGSDGIPTCPCGGLIKPDVVLYGEPLPSLNVYPAAGLLTYFRGRDLVLINKTRLAAKGTTLVFDEPIGEVFTAALS